MKDLYVITHAQARHHVENVVGGWHDSPLTSRGRSDAEAIATRLQDVIGMHDRELFSSDLLRTSQTADIIGARLDCPPILMHDLREISYGEAEGKPQSWLDARLTPAPEHNRLDHRFAIAGAETRREFAERIYRATHAIIDRPGERKIVVTHGFALTFVVAAWIKMPIEAAGHVNFTVKSGSITHLRQDDFWSNRAVLSLGDVTHLTDVDHG